MASIRSSLRISMPRLLPMTIIAMTALLLIKSVGLVLAATAPAAPAAAAAPGAGGIVPQAKASSAAAAPASEAAAAPSKTAAAPAPAKPVDGPRGAVSGDAKPENMEALAPAGPPVSDSERALLTDLRQRRLLLDAREATLAAREVTLAAVEKRLNGRVAELTGLQTKLEALEKQRQERDEANWQGLVKVYETMKPRDAAGIFNDLDLPILLPVLDRMKESKTAPILAAMLPDRARQATTELARMRAGANSIDPKSASAALSKAGG